MINGAKIKERRLSLRLSQAELARRAGVSQAVIATIEGGAQETARGLPRIAKALDIPLPELNSDFEATIATAAVDLETFALAVEVLLENLLPDLDDARREALGRLCVELIPKPRDENTGPDLRDRMRRRLADLLMESFLQR